MLFEVLEVGKLIGECLGFDIFELVVCICWYVEVMDKCYDVLLLFGVGVVSMIMCELIGVVGVVLLWNFLVLMFVWKIGFVLLVGNSVVVKLVE